jgi:DcmR-like sensory protein
MEPISADTHHHAVQFYRDEDSLFTTVAGFLSEGLVAHQPAVVIATLSHRAAIEEHLCGRLINCAKARRDGDLVMLDAEETLGQFMIGDKPDAATTTSCRSTASATRSTSGCYCTFCS